MPIHDNGDQLANVIDFPKYAEPLKELDAYFGTLDAAIGIKAQSYDGGGGAVFDSKASHELHMALRHRDHRSAVQKRTLYEMTLAAISPEAQHVLRTVMTPRRWEWSDKRTPYQRKEKGERSVAETNVRLAFRMGRAGTICLLALTLELPEVREAFAKHEAVAAAKESSHDLEEDDDRFLTQPTQIDLLRFLEWEAAQDHRRVLDTCRQAASVVFLRAVHSYQMAMIARNEALADISRETAWMRGRSRAVRLMAVVSDVR